MSEEDKANLEMECTRMQIKFLLSRKGNAKAFQMPGEKDFSGNTFVSVYAVSMLHDLIVKSLEPETQEAEDQTLEVLCFLRLMAHMNELEVVDIVEKVLFKLEQEQESANSGKAWLELPHMSETFFKLARKQNEAFRRVETKKSDLLKTSVREGLLENNAFDRLHAKLREWRIEFANATVNVRYPEHLKLKYDGRLGLREIKPLSDFMVEQISKNSGFSLAQIDPGAPQYSEA